ncbi:NAD(P)H-binding protein [Aurantimonas sp. MSK8Z-1]|uniref:NAD-dependent epimerase/dehydratase family protein n=1 Tax=Mangrovibrevibacter kandeliae TaxID=2968473 RepID=UPI00211794A2|nr:NAD-dependent epimerase/dehydratase family protein [Aurantimonas sp. MSK8Z-1]MCW4116465.1 NAD(P)H-binding protein [Aurantimonas sp. MSK8Z-1]
MPTAFILGGTGQIGRAAAARLAGDGWSVTLASRSTAAPDGPWRQIRVERNEEDSLQQGLGDGADLVLDCIAFDDTHADQLLALEDRIGRLAVVSSMGVYRDAAGRSLGTAAERGFPDFPVPIPEDHPTVEPGPEGYAAGKVALERRLRDRARVPVTILRPGAIHGPYGRDTREWWFVKRLLDGRKRIPLAYRGLSRFQTTSTEGVVDALLHGLDGRGCQVLNAVDADAPTVAEIGRTIMDLMDRQAELVGLPDTPTHPPGLGMTPWSVAKPMVCASSVPRLRTYADGIAPTIAWLVEATRDVAWRVVLPQLAAYPNPLFDYDLDERALALPGAAPIGI